MNDVAFGVFVIVSTIAVFWGCVAIVAILIDRREA